jgi:hypothetical protein
VCIRALGEHRLGIVTVPAFELASTLESENDGIVRFAFAFVYATAPLDCCFSTTVISRVLVPLAAAAALKGDDEWSARILGARDAVTERAGITVEDPALHDLQEQTERQVRTHLGPDRWAHAYVAGRKSSIDAMRKEMDAAIG